jgi:hypothetical protein
LDTPTGRLHDPLSKDGLRVMILDLGILHPALNHDGIKETQAAI